jgi:hypothetical protein
MRNADAEPDVVSPPSPLLRQRPRLRRFLPPQAADLIVAQLGGQGSLQALDR